MALELAESWWEQGLAWLRSAKAERALRVLIGIGALFFVATFAYAAARRLRYPYDLEWIESGILVSVNRIVHGQPLYARPGFGYVPFLYAPLYFYLCAWATKLTGMGFAATRLVSTISALGTQALLFFFVRRETRNTVAALAAAGIYASLYLFIEGMADIGRVDSLFLFLLLLAIYCTRFAPPLLAAVVWVLAFQTKQSVLPLAIPFLLTYWERARPMRVVTALTGYGVMVWGSIAWMNHLSGGWYGYYVFGTLKGLPGVIRMAALYVPEVLLRPMALVFAVIIAALLLGPVNLRSRRTAFYALGSVVMYGAFWYVHYHRGVGNTMQAVYVWTLLLFGLALTRLMQVPAGANAQVWRNALLIAVVLQMGSQVYNPGQFIPGANERKNRDELIAQVQAIPGDVYVMNHGWDAVLAGKPTHADGEAAGAVVDAGGSSREQFLGDVRNATENGAIAAIVVDGGYHGYDAWLTPEEQAHFPVHVAAAGAGEPRYLTSQPTEILLPCSAIASGLAAKIALDGQTPTAPAECGR